MPVFNCPGCAKKLRVSDQSAARRAKCPHCGKLVAVPASATLASRSSSVPQGDLGNPSSPLSSPPSEATSASLLPGSAPHSDTLGPGSGATATEKYDFLAPAQGPGEIGRLGSYRVLKVLGSGGMGVVFLAEDVHLKRPVALKAMKPAVADGPLASQRFMREAQTTAAIRHDHIVTIYQVGEDRGVAFLAMEFLEGESLDDRLKREGRLPLVDILRIGREIAQGLAAAHKPGLLHRDIKPANIWLEAETGRVKILDFGLARGGGEDSHITQTGTILGTPAYMAPEQARGEHVDNRCDLFSLGCVLYRMATGELPFKGKDTMSTLMSLATETPRAVRELDAGLPAELSDLVAKLLSKNRELRPPSAQAVVEMMRDIEKEWTGPLARPPVSGKLARPIQTGKTPAPSPGTPGMKGAGGRLPRWAWMAAAGAAAFVILLGVVLFVKTSQGTIRIELTGAATGAEVKVDGDTVDITGVDEPLHLRAGNHQLHIEGKNFETVSQTFTVRRGNNPILRVELQPTIVVKTTVAPPALQPMVNTVPVATPQPVQASTSDTGTATFFNGKNLTDWEGLKEFWRVEDGAIIGMTPADLKFNTFLCSKKSYRDFELRFQVRLRGEKGNSGVQVRSRIFDRTHFAVEGPQADMGDKYWGSLYGEQFGGMMKEAPAEQVNKVLKQDDFNDYSIKCVAKHCTIAINGLTTVDGDFATMPEEGIIGWQLHGNLGKMEVAFKNIQFQDLSQGTTVARPQTDGGWVQLFNGKDLAGWKPHPANRTKWTVKDGILTSSGPLGHLFTERNDYTNFHLRVEARVNAGGNSGLYFRTEFAPDFPRGYEAQIYGGQDPGGFNTGGLYGLAQFEDLLTAPDEWFTHEVIANANYVVIKVNNKTTTNYLDKNNTYTRGHLALQQHNPKTVVQFRKIEVKELPP